MKQWLAKIIAKNTVAGMQHWIKNPMMYQDRILHDLIRKAKKTVFGRAHQFEGIRNYTEFKQQVPIRDYEALKPYFEQALAGKKDVLWPGKPYYFAKTSGTTSGTKYIPITKESMPEHIRAAKNALLNYIYRTGKAEFLGGKLIFLQGSPKLEERSGISLGRLSGIVAHHVPSYLQGQRLPTYATNCIEDWENKIDAIVEETIGQDMRLISGIPPWMQMYFDRLSAKSDHLPIHEIFKNLSLLVHGGVNFEPYRKKLYATIGKEIDTIETYPASEGFIAFQDSLHHPGLLLQANAGMFFEFVPVESINQPKPQRLTLAEVELNKQYALILNTNAGLWGYAIGDTIKFVSKHPYRLIVTGRLKHFISAFGEHVIAEEVDAAMIKTAKKYGITITEFTVAPQVNPVEGSLPHHEWYIAFDEVPPNLEGIARSLDEAMQQQNSYYLDLRQGKVLENLKIYPLPSTAFIDYMRSIDKLGGQNKLPRLSNDRHIADALKKYIIR